ncbi:senescence-associated carboxylesterase 101-like isoform X2 [Eucalyptus grandis]|uniref:senescence-associated carboxylesterase 101-like isoform X2 n=1 Tax=Eucalyptus grandis TaxID=71139 RepID=UPI00192F0BFC|nr:senescence-associated carboxylesterase 101-like isoform X2 [Eucalyptus grandis]
MDRDKDSLFSNGLYLANLAVSSNLIQDSWDAIPKFEQRINELCLLSCVKSVFQDRVKIKEAGHPNYNVIAFVTSPVTTGCLEEERDLVPSFKIPNFKFLCSESSPTFHINKAAISLFNSLRDELSQLKEKVVASAKSEDYVPYIITGHCLGGSIASLFVLWLLNTLDTTKGTLPLCITFGSPLLGDNAFQQAVSQYLKWNSCFLHVVHKDDCFPRLFLHPSTTNPSQYKPFGTFLLCSESGGACFEDPKSIMELLMLEIGFGNQESHCVNYKTVIQRLDQRLIRNDWSWLNGQEADSYKAGVTTQVIAVSLEARQLNEGGTLIDKIIECERDVIRQRREALDPAKQLGRMKVYLTFLEWYMKVCKANGQGPGYYDSFKNARERRDNVVDKYKTILSDYWERVVKEAEKKPQIWGKPLRRRWLFGGTNYRRIVEPLDIAEYYKRGRKDYINRGRSKHYKLLEDWLGDYLKNDPKDEAGLSDSKLKNIESIVTEDSCFWARVEEAIQLSRLPESEGSSNRSKIANLMEFEEYVMGLIKKYKVSPDIFLEKSSYMQWWREYVQILEKPMMGDWWREYVQILEKPMMGDSHNSQLVAFMRKGRYKKYAEGSPSIFPEGAKISPSFPPRCLTLSLLLFLSLCICLYLFHFSK